MSRYTKFFIICFFPFCMWAFVANAEKDTHATMNKIFILDGKEYKKSDLIKSFVDAAFSETLWNEDAGQDASDLFASRVHFLSEGTGNFDATFLSEKNPWISPYVIGRSSFPKSGVLNKWKTQEVRIGIDWPIYRLDRYVDSFMPKASDNLPKDKKIIPYRESAYVKNYDEVYRELKEIIVAVLPDIEKKFGISFIFNEPFSPDETGENYAKIRIIPVGPELRQKNRFKFDRYSYFRQRGNLSTEATPLASHEYVFDGAVSFTPYVRSQVDGYLLLNPDNSIGMSICKVLPDVGRDMLRALITECVFRSLGLPEPIKSSRSHLGLWNNEYDFDSKLIALDGEQALFGDKPDYEEILKKYKHQRDLRTIAIYEASQKARKEEYQKMGALPDVGKDMNNYLKPSQYDLLMLSLLYCSALKPGMDKYETIRILSSQETCWSG